MIVPPKNATSDYYHNRAMDIKYNELKPLAMQIRVLLHSQEVLERRYESFISARNNAMRYENDNMRKVH